MEKLLFKGIIGFIAFSLVFFMTLWRYKKIVRLNPPMDLKIGYAILFVVSSILAIINLIFVLK